MKHSWLFFWVLIALLATACGNGPPVDADADADADGDCDLGGDTWEVEPPAEPAEPELPSLPSWPRLRSWECPERWAAVVHDVVVDEHGESFTWCEPPPIPRLRLDDYVTPLEDDEREGERPICHPAVDGTFPVVGYRECQPLGDPCPVGTWPEIPAEVPGARIYVLASSEAGDGSQSSPYGTIAEAVDSAEEGDVVVIGTGVYAEVVRVDKDLTLWGRCVQDTIIDKRGPPSPPLHGAIMVPENVAVTVRNLRLTESGRAIDSRGETTLEGVWIHKAFGDVIRCSAGTVVLSKILVDSSIWDGGSSSHCVVVQETGNVEIRETTFEQNTSASMHCDGQNAVLGLADVIVRHARSDYTGETDGLGIHVLSGTVRGRRIVLDRCYGAGVWAEGGIIALEDVISRRGMVSFPYTQGWGLCAGGSADVSIHRGLFEHNEAYGINTYQDGWNNPSVELEDVVVRETRPSPSQAAFGVGKGLVIRDTHFTMRRALIEGNHDEGIAINTVWTGPGLTTTAHLEDVVVRETHPVQHTQGGGTGIAVGGSVDLSIDRVLIDGNRGTGFYLSKLTSAVDPVGVGSAHIEDITVLDTHVEVSTGRGGCGIDVERPGGVVIARALVQGNHECGIRVQYDDVDVELENVTVRGTNADDSPFSGVGLLVSQGAVVSITKGLFEENKSSGIHAVDDGSNIQASELIVMGTLANEMDQNGGFGVLVESGAEATISVARLEENVEVGVLARGLNTTVTLEDVRVLGTESQELDEADPGAGLLVERGASLEVVRAVVQGNAHHGVLADGYQSTLSLADVVVIGTLPNGRGDYGAGLRVTSDARAAVIRALFDANRRNGIEAFGAASLSLEDVLVVNTESVVWDSRLGRGLHVEGGGDVSVVHSQLVGNRDVAITAFDSGTSLSLSEVMIADTDERACVDLASDDPYSCRVGRGYGLGAYDNASITIEDVEIVNSVAIGLQTARGGVVEGRGLFIHGSPAAVNLRSCPEDYDFEASIEAFCIERCELEIDESEMSIPEDLTR